MSSLLYGSVRPKTSTVKEDEKYDIRLVAYDRRTNLGKVRLVGGSKGETKDCSVRLCVLNNFDFQKANLTHQSFKKILETSPVEVYCSCPDFKSEKLCYSQSPLIPNEARMYQKDPNKNFLINGGCKHIRAIFNAWNDLTDQIVVLFLGRKEMPLSTLEYDRQAKLDETRSKMYLLQQKLKKKK